MPNLKEYIRKVIQEIIDEDEKLDEMSTSADAGAYATPHAFRGKKKGDNNATKILMKYKFKKVKPTPIKETLKSIIREELLNEVSYNKFKNDVKLRTKNEQLHKAIKEVKRKLSEINSIVEYTSMMKQELSESGEGAAYWKSTEANLGKIAEMVESLNDKIKSLK